MSVTRRKYQTKEAEMRFYREIKEAKSMHEAFDALMRYLNIYEIERALIGIRYADPKPGEREISKWGYYGNYDKQFVDWYVGGNYISIDESVRPFIDHGDASCQIWHDPEESADSEWFGKLSKEQREFEEYTRQFGYIVGVSFPIVRDDLSSSGRIICGCKCFDGVSRRYLENILAHSEIEIRNAIAEFHLSVFSFSDYAKECRIYSSRESLELAFSGKPIYTGVNDNTSKYRLLHERIRQLTSEQFERIPINVRQALEAILLPPATALDKPKPALPDKAPKLYVERDKKAIPGIVPFLREVWFTPWIEARVLTRADLRRLDPPAYAALTVWLQRNDLPDDLYLPTKGELIDGLIESVGMPKEVLAKVGQAVATRTWRKRK